MSVPPSSAASAAGLASTDANSSNSYVFPLLVMTSLFFIWGFITSLNDILIPHLKSAFDLTYVQAMLIQFTFFGAYFLVSIPAGALIRRIGYQNGVSVGLGVAALGCILFYPAAAIQQYWLFLAALFVMASGITLLQVSANPYVAVLGNPDTASSRLNFSQAINSVGHTVGPLFGALLIMTGDHTQVAETANPEAVQIPYLMIAGFLLLVAAIFKFLKLPSIEGDAMALGASGQTSAWQYPHLVLGAVAIFLYVGAEVSIGSFIINFISLPEIGQIDERTAAQYLTFYWGGAMVGRFIGSAALQFIKPTSALFFNAVVAGALLMLVVAVDGALAMWAVLAIGLFNSIMFPTIFTLGIRGLGSLTSQGSGILCLAIVGGAVVPMAQGFVADGVSLSASFAVPLLCYAFIAWYALVGAKKH
ncbi:sugar MFS transporter [Simiduia sp. 21SJ11W-1]|uniref:sugar MFS transporter n=1 Tax=Simiduia sp. 21SJ11W-1 TaxID=2909669 RepID=UPI00209F8CE1|nr:sugar MFS transporter [Simiduia sp. 21SJ11W-1]UTA48315.1 sugar MFS transporter [Simiduia sp. 21SJ11W-1]